jgi:hypothetical protein
MPILKLQNAAFCNIWQEIIGPGLFYKAIFKTDLAD